jgi:hypothetical protein
MRVPLLLPCHHADDDSVPTTGGKAGKGGKSAAGAKGGAAAAATTGTKRKAKSTWQRAHKLLFGWMSATFKVNGKKLLPHTAFLWRFMVGRRVQQQLSALS